MRRVPRLEIVGQLFLRLHARRQRRGKSASGQAGRAPPAQKPARKPEDGPAKGRRDSGRSPSARANSSSAQRSFQNGNSCETGGLSICLMRRAKQECGASSLPGKVRSVRATRQGDDPRALGGQLGAMSIMKKLSLPFGYSLSACCFGSFTAITRGADAAAIAHPEQEQFASSIPRRRTARRRRAGGARRGRR